MLSGCGNTAASGAAENSPAAESSTADENDTASQEAEDSAADTDTADPDESAEETVPESGAQQSGGETVLTMNGDTVSCTGSGADIDGTEVTITEAGTYRLSGTLTDGRITVNAKGAAVTLILDGADIAYSQGAPIQIQKAESVTISPAAGTENTVSDTENYVLAADEDEPDGAIYSKADLIFDGDGVLRVTGNYSKAVHGKDTVTFCSGTYVFTAAGDAVKGRDAVEITGGSITIDAGSDGIQSNNDSDAGLGNVTITGGTVTIDAGGDGIQAVTDISFTNADLTLTAEEDGIHCTDSVEISGGTLIIDAGQDAIQAGGDLTVSDGTFTITTGGGSADAPEHTEEFGFSGWFGTTYSSSSSSASAKGLKADVNLTVSGGTLTLDCLDHALHCRRTLTVTGSADLTIATGDDALHSDNTLSIEGGTVDITSSYEGLEAVFLEISGGSIRVVASDDGLNAAGGDSVDTDFNFIGVYGGEPEDLEAASYYVHITGGTLTVDAVGDGIDSNGALFIEGGEIIVSGPTSSANGALDYTTTGQITGGTVIAAGASGMAQNFDTSSSQVSLMVTLTETAEAGSRVTLTDSSGTVLADTTMAKRFNNVVISTPELRVGETYTLTCGDEQQDVTITDTITSIGSGGMYGFGSIGGSGDMGGGRGSSGNTGGGSSRGNTGGGTMPGMGGQMA